MIRTCTIRDLDQIKAEIEDFWGHTRTREMHHPIFVHQFGDTSAVIEEKEKILAYALGFYSQLGEELYIHLAAVRGAHQAQGLGQKLYNHLIEKARLAGKKSLKAITSAGNRASIKFHTEKMGMKCLGDRMENGILVFSDYSGEGIDRIVFEKVF
ncbi:MAG: GNAT family N-acetyltransferase [Bacteroidia bacterium]|nr:GNAT family N-acetyltransferase [Bacteroidia bacterium]